MQLITEGPEKLILSSTRIFVSYMYQVIPGCIAMKRNLKEWKYLRTFLVKDNYGNLSNKPLLFC